MRFEGRGVLVTGGGSGIGRSTCLRVAAEGARVAVVDLRAERAQETAQGIAASGGRAIALTADVSKSASVDNMAASAIDGLEVWHAAAIAGLSGAITVLTTFARNRLNQLES